MKTEKNNRLPLDDIEVLNDELMFVVGGAGGTTAGNGCGCDCGPGAGCGCGCTAGAGCGCGCSSGAGCGCVAGESGSGNTDINSGCDN